MKNQMYITDSERKRCQKVADAFSELYKEHDILVLDTIRYGFIKLQYYSYENGFDDVTLFSDSQELFENLWNDWLHIELLSLAKGTPMKDMDYEDILKCLPKEIQKELLEKQNYFKEKSLQP